MDESDNSVLVWRKSTRSSNGATCVEVSFSSVDSVAVRDSKDPSGPMISVSPAAWRSFVAAIKEGEFQ
jgi:hypothetical protein